MNNPSFLSALGKLLSVLFLEGLPPSTAPRGKLDSIDWAKIARFLVVQAVGFLITTLVPVLTGLHYVYHGYDFTPQALIVIGAIVETLRRLIGPGSGGPGGLPGPGPGPTPDPAHGAD